MDRLIAEKLECENIVVLNIQNSGITIIIIYVLLVTDDEVSVFGHLCYDVTIHHYGKMVTKLSE